MKNDYGGVIWTNHALQRLRERNISQGDAWATFSRPDQSRWAQSQGAWVYYKTWGDLKIEVVAKQNEKKEWIILSVWSKTVYDHQSHSNYPKKQNGSTMSKLFKLIFNK